MIVHVSIIRNITYNTKKALKISLFFDILSMVFTKINTSIGLIIPWPFGW